jgi:GNAT superfamily N-acetyltransferase
MGPEHPAYRVFGVTEETRGDLLEVDRVTWFDEVDPGDPDWSGMLDLSRAFGATPTGSPPFAGIYASLDMGVTVPAPGDRLATLPMAGLTWVAVHPDHRRRGVLTAMMEHHFRDLHERGEILAGLHASEPGIYGRFGYAVSALDAVLEVGRGAEPRAPGVDADDVTTRLETLGAEGVSRRVWQLHRELARNTLGQVTRTWAHAELSYTDPRSRLRGADRRRVLFAERDGRLVGYVIVRRQPRWEGGGPRGEMSCHELAAADPGALLALVRRLVAFDLVGTVEIWGLPVDSPAIWWLGGPRACVKHVYDGVWLRLVDVGACLERRGYAAETDLVLEVTDEHCRWNARRWRLSTTGDGSATCAPTTDRPDLRMPVQALAAAYNGGRTPGALAAEGLLTEQRLGAVRQLAAAMATPVAPSPGLGF